ncbi:MAG TPA: hypothetical protein VLK58_07810 [Conexibacter sp.]|nr:hypothetical protein [Conexibacter sp.]
MKRIFAIGAAVLACAGIGASSASAGSPRPSDEEPSATSARILYDCATSTTGLLQRRYSVRILRIALREIPTDVADYTGCPEAIRTAIEESTATVSATIKRTRRGGTVAGTIALLDGRGRTVDQLRVRRGHGANFQVLPGRYTVRADGRKRCTVRVTAREWRSAQATIICRR